jgi:hypothetical protein
MTSSLQILRHYFNNTPPITFSFSFTVMTSTTASAETISTHDPSSQAILALPQAQQQPLHQPHTNNKTSNSGTSSCDGRRQFLVVSYQLNLHVTTSVAKIPPLSNTIPPRTTPARHIPRHWPPYGRYDGGQQFQLLPQVITNTISSPSSNQWRHHFTYHVTTSTTHCQPSLPSLWLS